MLPPPAAVSPDKKIATLQYATTDLESIIQGIELYFATRKYRLESGFPGNGTYGIGNNTLRIFFGAFVKRFSFFVRTALAEDQQSVLVQVEKAISGAAGGVIGHSRMTKEFDAIIQELSQGMA